MQASIKQKQFIGSLISQYANSYPTLETIYNAIPKNNEKYPDTRADYRQLIIADMLNLSSAEASNIIGFLTGSKNRFNRNYSGAKAFKVLVRNFNHLIK